MFLLAFHMEHNECHMLSLLGLVLVISTIVSKHLTLIRPVSAGAMPGLGSRLPSLSSTQSTEREFTLINIVLFRH